MRNWSFIIVSLDLDSSVGEFIAFEIKYHLIAFLFFFFFYLGMPYHGVYYIFRGGKTRNNERLYTGTNSIVYNSAYLL